MKHELTAIRNGGEQVSSDAPHPSAVLAAFGIPGPAESMASVRGAWTNRVYRLETSRRAFAVKELRNPWNEPRWQEWLEEAWEFEQLALEVGVSAPVPLPNPSDGRCIAWVDRVDGEEQVPVRVHHWVDGDNPGPEPVSSEVARWAGQTVAKLHRLKVRPRDRILFPSINTDSAERWESLTQAARESGAVWSDEMERSAGIVSQFAALAREAGDHPEDEVMTHGDIDQKNLILAPYGPVLCDWDVVFPLVPRRELADVAFSMGAWEDFAIAREVIVSYRSAGGDHFDFVPSDLGQHLMIGLDWVTLNIERAVGLRPASLAEVELAQSLVPGLLADLSRTMEVVTRITSLLRS